MIKPDRSINHKENILYFTTLKFGIVVYHKIPWKSEKTNHKLGNDTCDTNKGLNSQYITNSTKPINEKQWNKNEQKT